MFDLGCFTDSSVFCSFACIGEVDAEITAKNPFIEYQCAFTEFLFTMNGIGPVIILRNGGMTSGKEDTDDVTEMMDGLSSSALLSKTGNDEECESLIRQGLIPRIGDVVVSVQGEEVLCLDEIEVWKYVEI